MLRPASRVNPRVPASRIVATSPGPEAISRRSHGLSIIDLPGHFIVVNRLAGFGEEPSGNSEARSVADQIA